MRGLTFGVFDGLCLGDVRFLATARAECEHLTVAVFTDAETERQGHKALQSVDERGQIVQALRAADDVVICDGDLAPAITASGAQLLFHGEEWLATPPLPGAWFDSNNVSLVFVPTPGRSVVEAAKKIGWFR